MANLYRLVIALLFSLALGSAHAVTASPAGYAFPQSPTYGAQGPTLPTVDAACAWGFNQYKNTTSGHAMWNGWVSYSVSGAQCNMKWASGGVANNYSIVYVGPSCPANSTGTPPSCVCKAGFIDSGSACTVAPPVNNCKAGASAGRFSYPQVAGRSMSEPYYICDGDTPSGNADGSVCVVRIDGSMGVGGVVYGEAVYTGSKRTMATCTGGGGTGGTADSPNKANSEPPVAGEPAPTPCKPGEATGSVNGVSGCYPAGASGQPVTTPTKTETTSPSTSGGTAPDTAGQIGQTQCVGSQCTTTTTTTKTTTDANGVTTTTSGTSTKTESKGDYCRDNPNSEQCESGSFGGSCTASFNCDGDAVMCAIALDQHKRNCTLFETPTTESALYDTEKIKTGSQVTNEAKTIGSGSFDTTDAIGGGSGCIADKPVTVAGKTFMLPFSSVCPNLALIGNVMLVVSFLMAGRIVARG